MAMRSIAICGMALDGRWLNSDTTTRGPIAMPNSNYKPKVILVTDSDEIASIRRNDYNDLIGIIDSKGDAYADPAHLQKWRENRTLTKSEGSQQ